MFTVDNRPMSPRSLAPQPPVPRMRSSHVPLLTRNSKASFACLSCKQRKSKCDQSSPCRVCQIHGCVCIYDETADQRRKVAKQRLLDEYQRQRLLLVGIIATIRKEEPNETDRLLDLIRSDVPLEQLLSYMEAMLTSSPKLNELSQQLSFGPDDVFGGSPTSPMSRPLVQTVPDRVPASGLPMNAQVILDVRT